jgi:threonine dehydrogenase-like Zn-dependent dehydrogenase
MNQAARGSAIQPAMTEQARRARAYWTTGCGQGEIREETVPPPGRDQVRVEARYSGVSRGTELLVHQGKVPVSEYERMRAPLQGGTFPWPVKYGYCSVGRVAAGDPAWLGRDVFCLHPHQTEYVVGTSQVVALPPGLRPEHAVLAANMETAVNAIWDADLKAGDKVSVVGAGVVGCLVAFLSGRHPGTETELIDIDAGKGQIAAALGVDFASPERARPDADLVIHASGAPPGLQTALGLAGVESTVVELSWYGREPVSLALGEGFHALRLCLRSSQVGKLPAQQRARWTHRRRLELALRLLCDERLHALIDSSAPFEQLPEVMNGLASGERRALCHRVEYAAS